MNNRPEMNEDFISSAGVPTIPLKPHKRRSFVATTLYAVVIVLLSSSLLVDYVPVLEAVLRIVGPFAAFVVLIGVIMAIVGLRIRRSLLLLFGLVTMVLSAELIIKLSAVGILIPLQLAIVLLVWYAYRRRLLLETTLWPVVVAAICTVAGMAILASMMGLISGVVVMPILIVATIVALVWEIRRQMM